MVLTDKQERIEALACSIDCTPGERQALIEVLDVITYFASRSPDSECLELTVRCYTVGLAAVEIDNAIDLLLDAGLIESTIVYIHGRYRPAVRVADRIGSLAAA